MTIKISQWDLIKLKSLYTAKESTKKKKMKSLPTEWEKIFAYNATDKGLISKTYKQLNRKKKPNQNMGRRPKQTFLQRRYTDS